MAGDDGTTFEIDIPVHAEGAAPAAAQLAELADRLTATRSAAAAAAQAVLGGEAAYRQAENAANRAALAVEKITLAANAQKGKLQAALDAGDTKSAEAAAAKLQTLLSRQTEATAKANAAKAALTGEASALDKLKTSATAAAAEEAKVSKALETAKQTAAAADKAAAAAAGSGNAKKTARAFSDIGGPLGSLGQKFFGAKDTIEDFGETLGDAGPYALAAAAAVAVVAGVAAISAAAIAGVAQITAWAVSLADAARSNRLLAEGIAQSVAGGAQLDKTIGRLEGTVPQTREELMQMAADLAKTGLKGEALGNALEDAATKAAKAKFGPDWQKQMLSIDQQQKKLKSNISGLFSGLNIDKLLENLAKLVGLFDSTSVTGQSIKIVFESLFQPLIDGITAFIPKMVTGFIHFEILVMQCLIAIKPFGSTILLVAEIFGVLAAIIIGVVAIALGIVIFSITMLAVGVALVVGAIALLVYGFIWLGQQTVALVGAINDGLIGAMNWVVDTFHEVVAFLSGLSLGDIGTQLIQGLVDGIMGAGGGVLSAITGVVSGGISAAKKLLGIASPSKVFADIGENTGAGMAAGVDKSTDSVQGSLESMVTPPPAKGGLEAQGGAPAAGPAPGAGASSSSSGAAGANLAGATFNFFGVAGMEDAEAIFTRILEGDVAQAGGAAAPQGGAAA